MILIIDNYDSFTFNLYQLIGEINPDIKVVRNDKITIDEIESLKPSHIIISPGPGNPQQAGICLEVIRQLAGRFPILGVCLGHQAIGEAFGGKVVHAPQIVHGKSDRMYLTTPTPIFKDMPDGFEAARYHSLIVEPESLPDCLEVTAETVRHEIMALQHKTLPVYGVQFHPESIMTPQGRTILKNFLDIR
jgi:anthranilate synthase/aminodeoxychorismate synthase-like glutamine amidotransferase